MSDAGFVELANQLVEGGIDEPGMLEDRLRERHPRAVVRPRILSGEPIEVWYVYREGYWVRSDTREEREA